MRQSVNIHPKPEILKLRNYQLYLILVVLVVVLAVFQDYLFSEFQNTGFYISESLLYNAIWGFLLPFGFLQSLIFKRLQPKEKTLQLVVIVGISISLSVIHILCFTFCFMGISTLIFSPAHEFWRIFKSALSNQLYIIFLFYLLAPYVKQYVLPNKRGPVKVKTKYPSKIKIKSSSKFVWLKTETIQLISADKPYTAIITGTKKYLDNDSLKHLEASLDPQYFIRVHRSKIINLSFIKELKSRQNGDYDAILENGSSVRLSRHYKDNWERSTPVGHKYTPHGSITF